MKIITTTFAAHQNNPHGPNDQYTIRKYKLDKVFFYGVSGNMICPDWTKKVHENNPKCADCDGAFSAQWTGVMEQWVENLVASVKLEERRVYS